jgi:hypothetical protein
MERWSLTSSRWGLRLALSVTLLAIGGCGGTSGSATAENAQAKAWVERALNVVASDYQDFHNYTIVSAYTLKISIIRYGRFHRYKPAAAQIRSQSQCDPRAVPPSR